MGPLPYATQTDPCNKVAIVVATILLSSVVHSLTAPFTMRRLSPGGEAVVESAPAAAGTAG